MLIQNNQNHRGNEIGSNILINGILLSERNMTQHKIKILYLINNEIKIVVSSYYLFTFPRKVSTYILRYI